MGVVRIHVRAFLDYATGKTRTYYIIKETPGPTDRANVSKLGYNEVKTACAFFLKRYIRVKAVLLDNSFSLLRALLPPSSR